MHVDAPADPATTGDALAGLEHSLASVVRLLSGRATTGDLAQRCGYDLPPASWALLEHLEAHGGLRVSDIAACHGVDVSSITPRLKRLETAGLVDRARASTDGRAYVITLTAKGARALAGVHAARRELLERALEGADPAEVSRAGAVLRRLADELAAGSSSPGDVAGRR